MKTTKFFLLTCLFMISFSVNAQRTVTKDIGSFDTLKVYDHIEVNLIKSDYNKIIIKGKNVDDVEVINRKGKLKLRSRFNQIFNGSQTEIDLYYTSFEVLDVNEGGKISSSELISQNTIDLKAQEGGIININLESNFLFAKSVTGGNITLNGSSKSIEILINTGGVIEAKDLKSEYVDISITSGGRAEINCSEKVDLRVKMGGNILIYGNPNEINKSIFMGGSVKIME